MNNAAALTLVGLSVVFGLMPIGLTINFARQLKRLLAARSERPSEPVTVIVPCKGIDQGFSENIESLLAQKYPDLRVIFVVATNGDTAFDELCRLRDEHSRTGSPVRCEVAVAGIDNKRAQKLSNQLHGISQVEKNCEFLVFLDSDIRPDPDFIGRLIAPLSIPGIGATTGFRWYHPPKPTLGSMLRSTWNAGALPLLTNPRSIFAFGGAMAIRRADFERADIADAWDKALSDDFPFTTGVKRLGLEIRFVPTCIAVSFESSTLAQTVEFTNRQSIISRIYFPTLWWSAAIAHSLVNFFVLCGIAAVATWIFTIDMINPILIGCLSVILLQFINALILLTVIPRLFPNFGSNIVSLRKYYVFCAPLASLLSLANTIYSLTTRQIVWRGIRYELVSASETRVISGS